MKTTRDEDKWDAVFSAAARLGPAEQWRHSIARTLREATGAEAICVMTCPPNAWEQHSESTTYPSQHREVARRAQGLLLCSQQGGPERGYLLKHSVSAPLEQLEGQPLAESFRRQVLAPAGLRGLVVAKICDENRAVIGAFLLLSQAPCAILLRETEPHLGGLAKVAGFTLGGALQLAAGCRPRALAPDATRPGPLDVLTPREREIVELAAEGLRNINIAARLQISEATVAVHLKKSYAKLGIASRVALAALTLRQPSRLPACGAHPDQPRCGNPS